MLGNDDPDIPGSSSQNVIQIFELCTVVCHPVEGKFVRDLQRKKAKPIKATAKVMATKWIKRAEGSCHSRTKCRHEHTPIRRYGIRWLSFSDPADRRSCMRADVIEIHAERVRTSPKLAALNMQPKCGRPQLGKIIRLTRKTDDAVRSQALSFPRPPVHHAP